MGSIMVKSRRRAERPAVKTSAEPESSGPDFVMLLADPEVRLLMQADNVDEADLLNMLKTVTVRLRGDEPKGRKGPGYRIPDETLKKYRRGVGIMLVNRRSEILIARRNDVSGEAWQMPQGGINRGELPRKAAYRELREEIGTDNARIIAESAGWFYYDLPEEIANKAWSGRWKGQRQKWFVMYFDGTDTEIDLATSDPEFDAWRWATVHELEQLAVSFKKNLYVALLEEFASVIRNLPHRPEENPS
jgi:8-oxo-dGTP pyrophosphatase MutT (NUDIX family)